jgi:hypothetical protein
MTTPLGALTPRTLSRLVTGRGVSWVLAVTLSCAATPTPTAERPSRVPPRAETTTGALSLPPPNPKLYASVRDAAKWQNPYLIVGPTTVQVTALGRDQEVPVSALEDTLRALSRSAWPYGAVVGVQEQGLIAGDGSDDAPIAANKAATVAVLGRLGVTIEWWPTG